MNNTIATIAINTLLRYTGSSFWLGNPSFSLATRRRPLLTRHNIAASATSITVISVYNQLEVAESLLSVGVVPAVAAAAVGGSTLFTYAKTASISSLLSCGK